MFFEGAVCASPSASVVQTVPLASVVDQQQQHNVQYHHHLSHPTAAVGPVPPVDSESAAAVAHRQQTPPSPMARTKACVFDYRGERVAGFQVGASCRIFCLPQVYELFLKHFVGGLHTVYTKLKRLGIQPLICSVEQVRALRNLGAIQSGVNRCKLIETSDFETLYRDCTNTSARPGRPLKRTISDNLHDSGDPLQKRANEPSSSGASFNFWHSPTKAIQCDETGTAFSERAAMEDLSQRHSADEDGIYASTKPFDCLLSPFMPNHQHLMQQYVSDQQQTTSAFDFVGQQCHGQQSTTASSSSNTTIPGAAPPHHLLFNIQQAIVAAAAMAATVRQQQQQQRSCAKNGDGDGQQRQQQQSHVPNEAKDPSEERGHRRMVEQKEDAKKGGNAGEYSVDSPQGSTPMPSGTQMLATSTAGEEGSSAGEQQQRPTQQKQSGDDVPTIQIRTIAAPPFQSSSNSPMLALNLSSPSAMGGERSRDSSTFGTNSSSSITGDSSRREALSGSEERTLKGRRGTDDARTTQSGGSKRRQFKADNGRASGRQSEGATEERSSNTSNGNSESPPTYNSPPSSGDGYCSFNNSDAYQTSDQQQQCYLLNRLTMAVDRMEKVLMDQCRHFYSIANELRLARQHQERTMLRCRAEKRRSAILHHKYNQLSKHQLKRNLTAGGKTSPAKTTSTDRKMAQDDKAQKTDPQNE